MILGWLMKRIFVDKRARARMDTGRKKVGKAAVVPEPVQDAPVEHEGEREKLLRETMALYRKRRAEYEKLDGDLRGRFDKVVDEVLGDKKE